MIRVDDGRDRVRRITLDRPEAKNALTPAMIGDLIDAIRGARSDPDARCVLLTGTGDAFCSGMDLRESTVKEAASPDFDPRTTSEALRSGVQTLVRELWELDKPSVAAVNGFAVGPGAHLALACDFVFVHPGTQFRWSFARYGLVVDAAGAYLLPRLVGLPRAKQMILLGEGSTGHEAVEDGLAYRCVPMDELHGAAEALAADLAAGPTRSLGLSKRMLNRSFETDLPTSLEFEGHLQSLATASHDLVEGMTAFRERRDPNYEGR